jgi:cyclopropane fatty-acyl-phospholipid synthase-like methyltransferase
MIESLTVAEQQLLIAVSTLQERGEAADTAAIDALAEGYFGIYREVCPSAYGRLVARGLLLCEPGSYALSLVGQPLAARLRAENPRHRYFYDEYFTRCATSRAHAAFCERVYGRDLCQHGMMDMRQLGKLIDVLGLDAGSRVLELGCGNGLVAEHISDATRAHVTGIDTSSVGIRQATERTQAKRSRLAFACGDMRQFDYPLAAFDTAIAIDTLYYVADLELFLARLQPAIVPGGQVAAFVSSWVGAQGDRASLRPDQTPFARALCSLGWAYRTWDFSAQEADHWRLKFQVAAELEADFVAEGNAFLFHKRFIEAEYHQTYVDCGCVSRYLYLAEVPDARTH